MINPVLLGVFENIYPDADMTIPRCLLISAVGFIIVFIILGILALFVKAMGAVFDTINGRKTVKPVASPLTAAAAPSPAVKTPAKVELIDVTDEEAAVIMAIVSDRSGIPLNRLVFNSIKKTED